MDFDVGVGGPETNPLQIPKGYCATFYLVIHHRMVICAVSTFWWLGIMLL